jgi:hypothetical protein
MLRGFGLVTAVLSAAVRLATAAAAQEPAVSLFDTGSPSADPLPPEAIALRQGWTAIPEGGKPAPFKGDAVLANGQVALVIRGKAPAAELYSRQGSGYALRSRLAPALPGGGTPSAVASLGVADNAADAAAVRAAYRLAGGADASVVFSVSAGLPAVKAQPGAGLDGLRIEAPCRLVVVPDFFADDIVLDAPAIPTDRAEAPADNFLMMMLGAGEAIVTAIWDKAAGPGARVHGRACVPRRRGDLGRRARRQGHLARNRRHGRERGSRLQPVVGSAFPGEMEGRPAGARRRDRQLGHDVASCEPGAVGNRHRALHLPRVD